jgi:hypothetical protein
LIVDFNRVAACLFHGVFLLGIPFFDLEFVPVEDLADGRLVPFLLWHVRLLFLLLDCCGIFAFDVKFVDQFLQFLIDVCLFGFGGTAAFFQIY